MILSESELELGRRGSARASSCSTGSCSTPSSRRARRSRKCCRSRPTCSSSRSRPTGPTASASTASRASCTPPPARRSRRRRGARTPARPVRVRRGRGAARVPGAVPALHRARVRGRHDRALAAVAEGAADRGRAAADQQRRRHHQLRDAAHRPAAARVRPRPRRRRAADRAPRATTASRCRRSTGRRARSTTEMVVIEDADGPTSIAGLMGGARSEVAAGHDARAAGGRDLERPEHPPQLVGARPAQRGLRRFEKGLQPEQCMHAQAIATQLMIELCGATRRARHDRRRPRAAGRSRRDADRLREARVQAILGVSRRARSARPRSSSALDFASRAARATASR